MITVRICTSLDIPKIQTFIDQKWRAGHIFSYDADLLKWQHLDTVNNRINYIVAEKKEDNKLIAIFGFIPTSQYDIKLQDQKDFWLAIWKIDTDIAPPGVGNLLLRFFVDTYQPNSIGAIGINDRIEKFYKFLGYTPGVLNHYYYLNPQTTTFCIAEVVNYVKVKNDYISAQIIEEVNTTIIDIPNNSVRPLKTLAYLKNRYFLHPRYKYRYFVIKNNSVSLALFVIRKITVAGSSCLRIIDIFGNIEQIDNLEHHFDELLKKENACSKLI